LAVSSIKIPTGGRKTLMYAVPSLPPVNNTRGFGVILTVDGGHTNPDFTVSKICHVKKKRHDGKKIILILMDLFIRF